MKYKPCSQGDISKRKSPSLVRLSAGSLCPDVVSSTTLFGTHEMSQGALLHRLIPKSVRARPWLIYFPLRTILFQQDLISLTNIWLLQAEKKPSESDKACNLLKEWLYFTSLGERILPNWYHHLHDRAHGPANNSIICLKSHSRYLTTRVACAGLTRVSEQRRHALKWEVWVKKRSVRHTEQDAGSVEAAEPELSL